MNMDIILVSILIILSFILTFINWKILKETIIIRKESIRVRKAIGEDEIMDESK